jgi:hypothetical protein
MIIKSVLGVVFVQWPIRFSLNALAHFRRPTTG